MNLHKKDTKNQNKNFNSTWFFQRVQFLRSYNVNLKEYVLVTYPDLIHWKKILYKICLFLVLCAILMPISLALQNWALNISTFAVLHQTAVDHIEFIPIGNPGIEYSHLADTAPWVVFFIESITIILASLCLLILEPKFYYLIPMSFCLIGGIMNTASRASYHVFGKNSYFAYMARTNPMDYRHTDIVIDYWHITNTNNIFNFNDTLVISGVSVFVLALISVNMYIFLPNLIRKNS